MGEGAEPVSPHALVVGAAMTQRCDHCPQARFDLRLPQRRLRQHEAGDAAHRYRSPFIADWLSLAITSPAALEAAGDRAGLRGRPVPICYTVLGPARPPSNGSGSDGVMAFLVTGSAGFIGFHVAAHLLDRGEQVIGIDNLNPYYDVGLKRARPAELEG